MENQKIKGGYLLLPRIMREWDVMQMPPINRELWLYLFTHVVFTDYKELKRGQGFFRFNQIQEDLSWYVGFRKMMYSKPQLTKSLRRLKSCGMITTMKATHGILITICKYDYYQDALNYEGNNEGNEKRLRRQQEGININNKGRNKGTFKNKGEKAENFSEMNYEEGLK